MLVDPMMKKPSPLFNLEKTFELLVYAEQMANYWQGPLQILVVLSPNAVETLML